MVREPAETAPALVSVSREINDGRTTVVLDRDFAQSPEHVWTMIVDPERLSLWAPHTADRNLSTVGKVVFTMLGDVDPGGAPSIDVPGVVLVADEPSLLEHSWATDMLDWRIETQPSGCTLTLRHTLADAEMASAVAAGWHLCLDTAAAVLAGHVTTPVRGMEAMKHGWADLNERYADLLGVQPSRIGDSEK
jgi:uncharacterized protein YndB with AHSA1/START domain